MSLAEKGMNKSCLVADIGGTNARFAVARMASDGKPELSGFRAFPCGEYHNLESILEEYLANFTTAPDHACLAAAGPVVDGKVHLTNLGWELDAKALTNQFSFKNVRIINDFAALAQSTTVLPESALINLLPGTEGATGPVSVMGPGTGFGVSIIVKTANETVIISSEGGHISFVPHGKKEQLVWKALTENMGRVTVETLLSGVGIMRIYRELCHLQKITPLNYEPSTISNMALDHGDPICLETLTIFCSMLGNVAGDLALAQGATGGVYLAGGILPKMAEFLQKSGFAKGFLDKAPMQKFVSAIPVNLIMAPDAALYGAAANYWQANKL